MKTKTAVALATIYLIVFTILADTSTAPVLCAFMFLCSPLVIVLMVLIVLTEENYDYPELAEGEEWGYRDKPKHELK